MSYEPSIAGLVEAAEAAGLEVTLHLVRVPSWAGGRPQGPGLPEWGTRISNPESGIRYPNETNLSTFLPPTGNLPRYIEALADIYGEEPQDG